LRTIADSDLIGVVSAGKFVEVGHPLELLQRDESQFRKLAEESHEYEELVNISSRNRSRKEEQ
jgi:ABC-type multidrug transport system fused ATPase/permease subunit